MLDSAPSFDFPMTPDGLAAEIGIPLADWPGNCHAIACAVRDLVPVAGMRVARGHWEGSVSRKSVYTGGLQQHSWLVAPDGRILDPTRWAITHPGTPFIYLGVCDHYDEGGRARAACMPPVLPGRGPDFRRQVATLTASDQAALADHLGLDDIAAPRMSDQLHRQTRIDPDDLADASALYALVQKAGLKAIIPIDSWTRVMAPETLYCRASSNRLFTLPPAEDLSPQQLTARLLVAFCLIEARPQLEDELAEHDISLDEYHRALTLFEKWDMPLRYFPTTESFIVGLVLSDILGQGFGTPLRVERYAASLGYDRTQMAAALNEVAAAFGLCTVW